MKKNDSGTNNESGKSKGGIQKQKRGYCLSGKGILIAEGSDTSFFSIVFGLNSRIFSLLVSIELLIEEWYISYPPCVGWRVEVGDWKPMFWREAWN